MNTYLEGQFEEFNKITEHFKKEISNLRTGRANPALIDAIMVDAYGAKTPINGLASISVPDARCMLIAPWDKTVLKNIEKSLVDANLGLSIVNEGDKIRATVPLMTEENRKDLVKNLNERMEKARVSIRQVRDVVKEAIEQAEKDKKFGEDDKFRFVKELDEAVVKRNDELKDIRDKKEKDIMTI